MNVNGLMKELKKNRRPVEDKIPPNKSGVYAIFLKDKVKLGEISEGQDQIIYIGEASNLRKRRHFDAKDSGFSTLRRTIGAILKDELALVAIPRSSGSGKSAFKFNRKSEQKISAWMHQNLDLSFAPIKEGYKTLEKDLIRRAEPVLNLTLWENPAIDRIAALRSVCKTEAQSK